MDGGWPQLTAASMKNEHSEFKILQNKLIIT